MTTTLFNALMMSLTFSLMGIVIFVAGFLLLDKLTPYQLWREICEKQNVALAILIGAICIGIAMIISAAIHG